MKWRSLSFALPGLMLLLATEAGAQSDDQRAGARAAATAGGQAFMEKRWSDAVDLFTRAESLVHSPVHLLYTARALEKMGSFVKARETYIKITNDELPASAPSPWREAKADAEKELEALEPRVPYVTLTVQGAGSKPATVSMDGKDVPPALLGVPRPVDPGEHRFEARAEGMQTATSTITLKERHSETVVLTLAPGGTASPGGPTPMQPGAQAPQGQGAALGSESSASTTGMDTGGHGPSPVTYVALGVGAVGLVVGTVFLIQSNNSVDKANQLCNQPGGTCPTGSYSQVHSYDNDARSQRTISTVGFVAGGLGVAAGGVLWFVTGKKKHPAAAEIRPWVGLGSAGMSGHF